jgi:hypothetical protein
LDLDLNDQPIYFEDPFYADILVEKGYRVEPVDPIPLPLYLASLPDHSLIVVAVSDEGSTQFLPEFAEQMAEYGFHRIVHTKLRHSYINVIYKNKGFVSLHEEISELPIERDWSSGTLINGVALPIDLHVVSKGALVGNGSDIRVNGSTCSKNQRGLNFAVVDMESGKVVDMFAADTFATTSIDNGMYRAFRESVSLEVAL